MNTDPAKTLVERLAEVRALAPANWPPSTPVSEAELSELESTLGAALPAAYRDFLHHAGTGPGPYYGLHRLADLHINAKDRDTTGTFPLTLADFEEQFIGARARSISLDADSPGCLEIGHQGCADFTVLVLTGDLAGTVCDLSEHQWSPARAPHVDGSTADVPPLGLTPTFDEWYGAWLTGQLSAFQK